MERSEAARIGGVHTRTSFYQLLCHVRVAMPHRGVHRRVAARVVGIDGCTSMKQGTDGGGVAASGSYVQSCRCMPVSRLDEYEGVCM